MSDQDWKPVVIRAKPATQKTAVRTAQQSNPSSVQTQKKNTAGTNKQKSTDYDIRKLDQDDGEEAGYEVKRVGISMGKKIQQGRQAKGWTQKQLAEQIQEQQSVVQTYENGKAVPNQKVISKMEKALGVKLRGD